MSPRTVHPRSVIARLQALKLLLASPRTRYYLADKLEVTTRTVNRDLEFVQETLGWKLHISIGDNGLYSYRLLEAAPVL